MILLVMTSYHEGGAVVALGGAAEAPHEELVHLLLAARRLLHGVLKRYTNSHFRIVIRGFFIILINELAKFASK